MHRREFLKRTGLAAGGALAGGSVIAAPTQTLQTSDQAPVVTILSDPADPIAASAPVRWAMDQFNDLRKITAKFVNRVEDAPREAPCVLAVGAGHPWCALALAETGAKVPDAPESLVLATGKLGDRSVLAVCGRDPRGLVYGLTDVVDRLRTDPSLRGLTVLNPVIEQPANKIRAVMRLFSSDVEDLGWFHDRAFWRRYLTMLATERFNRFSLALGLGYDFTSNIRDACFHFAYPFLITVPGYDVRASGVSDAERDRNLETLRFISDETAARGLHFQLGIWTHAYKWTDSPQANHVIEGLSSGNHASYCRDALAALLKTCPAINGVTFRIHGESGVPEGNYSFWKTVFEGVVRSGRRIEIDMHAKGMDSGMIDVALATGMPVNISPKFWAEHMGLPYHQAAIRPTERPPKGAKDQGFFSKSSGSRSFLRYGYGDLLCESRRYGVLHRMWPGTQRLLQWGDPAFAAAYGRASSFCGSDGIELFEPLSFKGRKGSGLPGRRDALTKLGERVGDDFEKYRYGYRLWGRLSYNPDTHPQTWRRLLDRNYQDADRNMEAALSSASRILPLLTTAHCPSAANNNFWPEIYLNMPMVNPNGKLPYSDTPSPKRFGAVSPLDPQLFSRIDDFADDLLRGKSSPRYSPWEVAGWLDSLAEAADRNADNRLKHDVAVPLLENLVSATTDIAILSGLGTFFARKLRAGVYYALYERTHERRFLDEAIRDYTNARKHWAKLSETAKGFYVDDITFGLERQLRGHWADRLAEIDQDIADLERVRQELPAGAPVSSPSDFDKTMSLAKRERRKFDVKHVQPPSFQRGQPLPISLTAGDADLTIRLLYRHVNQAEEFCSELMTVNHGAFEAAMPAAYTDSDFPLQYYFEIADTAGNAAMHPGFAPALDSQPYFVVRSKTSGIR